MYWVHSCKSAYSRNGVTWMGVKREAFRAVSGLVTAHSGVNSENAFPALVLFVQWGKEDDFLGEKGHFPALPELGVALDALPPWCVLVLPVVVIENPACFSLPDCKMSVAFVGVNKGHNF